MTLAPGARLGPYEIVAAIGAGGMGEVYRARDTRLGRDVAVKVLPQQFSADGDLKQRFEREAKAISSFSHPHICQLYDIGSQNGTDYLVMEYLEGETLAGRLAKGPMPVNELLKVGIDIADALDKAHRQGIIHRDLKPGNIMLTKAGAKLMDFGLAKSAGGALGMAAASSASPLTPSSPTGPMVNLSARVSSLTQKGMIVGTFQYMAPEVLQGVEADARSDIFSLGCVLYEMATGKHAFEGKTQISVLAAILEKDPEPISTAQPLTPPALEMVVRSCLEKDPDERLQTAHDVKLQLNWTSQVGVVPPAPKVVAKNKTWPAWMVAGLALVLAIAGFTQFLRRPSLQVVHATILPPEKTAFFPLGDVGGPAVISPDGEKVAFVAKGPDGPQALWVRPLGSATAQRLEGTDGAYFPFWSADSRFLGYFGSGKVNKIAATGGPITGLADAPNGRGGSWSKDDVIIYAPDFNSALMRVSAHGGTPQPATTMDLKRHTTHRWPWFLPDGKHFLYLATNHSGGVREQNGIYFASLDGKENRLLLASDSGGEYAGGYLLFHAQTSVMAQPFDSRSGTLSGDVLPVVDRVQYDGTVWHALFSASAANQLIYHVGGANSGSQLAWFDRSGKQLGLVGERGEYMDPRISPDGSKIAVAFGSPSEDIWVFDSTRQSKTRLTFDPPTKFQPSWSPDGQMIAYSAQGAAGALGDSTLYVIPANGGGKARPVGNERGITYTYPSWTPDGKTILFIDIAAPTGNSIEAQPLDGGKPTVLVSPANPQSNITHFRLSPNGRWIAYTSTESGASQVYVTSASGQGGKWQISVNDGDSPAWRGDGKELYFLDAKDNLISVEVSEKDNDFSVGQLRTLFRQNASANGVAFDATRDGKRFLIHLGNEEAAAPLNVILNWTPTGRR